jgi:hypothetical protein
MQLALPKACCLWRVALKLLPPCDWGQMLLLLFRRKRGPLTR